MRNDNVKNTTEAKNSHSHKKKANQITQLNSKKTKINKSIELNNDTWNRVFDAVSDWILIIDLKGKILYSNKTGERFTDIPIEKIIGQQCCKLIHGSNKHRPGCPIKTMDFSQNPVGSEIHLHNGKWISVTVEPIKNKDNKIESYIHIVRDITVQKRTQETLSGSEQKYNIISTKASDAITYLDSLGRIVDINDRVVEIFGGERNKLINQHFTKLGLFSIKDIPKYIKLFKSVLTGKKVNATVKINNKKGITKYIESSASLINIHGTPARIMVISKDVTEKKLAEEVMKRSSIIIDSTTDAVITTNTDGIITSWNKGAERIFGYNKEEAKGKSVAFLYKESDIHILNSVIAKLLKGKDIPGLEITCINKNGQEISVLLSLTTIKDKKGKIVELVGITKDITDRKETEELLRTNDTQLSNAAKIAKIAYWEYDINNQQFIFNDQFYSIFKTTTEQVGSNRLSPEYYAENFIHPDDRSNLANEMMTVKNTSDSKFNRQVEHRIIYSNGKIGTASVRYFVRKENNGQPPKIHGVIQDISEYKKTLESLRESEERYRQVISTTTDAMILLDAETRNFIDVNKAAEILYGYNRKEFLSLKYDEITTEIDNSFRSIRELLQKGTIKVPLRYHKKKNGQVFPVEISGSKFKLKRRNVLCGIIRDITERKKIEQALQTSEAQLSNAMSISHIGHWEYDVLKDEFTFNDHFYSVLRTSVEQVGSYTMSSKRYAEMFIHPDDRSIVAIETNKAIETSDPNFTRQLEHRILYADGETGTISVRFNIVKDNQGRTIKTYGANQDITIQKKAQKELIESEEKYRNLFAEMGYGFVLNEIIYDKNGKPCDFITLETNQALERILNIKKELFINNRASQILTEQEFQNWLNIFGKVITTNTPTHYEEYVQTQNKYFNGYAYAIDKKQFAVIFEDVTKRKEAEDKLQASELWLNNIYNSLSEAVFVITPDRKLTNINITAELMFGYNEEELSQCSTEVLHVDHEHYIEFGKRIEEAFKNKRTANFEFEVKRKNGEIFPSEHTVSLLKDSKGKEFGIVSVVRDITERKKHESALRQSEEKFRNVVENASEGILVIQDYKKAYYNPRWLEITGYSNEEYKDIEFLSLIHPEDLHFVTEAHEKHSNQKLLESNTEFRLITKSKEIKYLSANTSKIQWENKSALLVILEDISFRKKAENALSESERKYRLLFENMINGLALHEIVLDDNNKPVDYKFLEVNSAFEKLTGLKRDDILNKKVTEIMPAIKNDPADWINKYAEVALTGKEIRFEDYSKPLDKWYSVLAYQTKKGKFATIFEDITERKKAEDSLRKSEARYELAQRIGGIGTWEWNIETNEVYWSKEIEPIFGFKEGQFDGSLETVKSRIHPEDSLLWENSVRECLEKGIEHNIKYRIILPDGSINWIHALGNISVYENSVPMKMLGIVADISEQKIAEEALRENEILLKETQKLAKLGGWEWDIVQNKATWTDEVYNIYGVGKDFDTSDLKKILSFYDESDRESLKQAFEKCLNEHEPYDIEVRFVNAQGKNLWCRTIGTPVLENGQVIKLRGNFIDITKRKKAEQEHLANLRFFESMDRVNRAIQGASNLESMMTEVLDEVLSIFDCDRACLIYPCDPEATVWQAYMERTKPEWPGVLTQGLVVPMDPEVANIFRISKDADGPVEFGPGYEEQVPSKISERFNIQSQITLALYPKFDKPWNFVIHQCSHSRVWTHEEKRIFKEIGRRLEDALTSLLISRELKESEEKYRLLVETLNEGIWKIDTKGYTTFVNLKMAQMLGYTVNEMLGKHLFSFMDEKWVKIAKKQMKERENGIVSQHEFVFQKKTGESVNMLINTSPIFDNKGNYAGALAGVADITGYVKAMEEIKTSQVRYRELFEHMPSGVAVYDIIDGGKDFIFKDFNRAGEKFDKVSRKELIGKSIFEVFTGIEEFGLIKAFRKAIKSGSSVCHPTSLYKDNNLTAWYDNYIYTLPSGELVAVFDDVTEKKKADEALHENERLLNEVGRIAQIGGWEMDLISKKSKWTKGTYDIVEIDYKKPAPGPDEHLDYYLPEYRPIVESALNNLIEKNIPLNFEAKAKTAKGNIKWFRAIGKSIRKNGICTKVFGTLQDITEQKEVELVVQRNLKALQQAEEIALLGIFERNWQTGKGYWSDGFYRLLGLEPQQKEYSHDLFMDFIHPDDKQRVNKHIQQTISLRKSMNIEFRLICSDGTIKHIHGIALNFYDVDGKPLKTIGTFQDITDNKRVEDVLNNHRRLLEKQMYLSKTLLDAIPYIAMLIKPKTREIVASNKAAIKVGAIPGKTCYQTWAQKTIPCKWCKAPNLWETGKEQHVELEHMGTIWEAYWIHVSDDLYMHFAFDITVRKQNEERILKYQEQLKSLASQLTLTEEKERYRIATHLHDQIGQYLAVSRIKTVELLNSDISKNTESTLNLIEEWLHHAIKETRSLTYDLSSPILHELGIEKAVVAWLDDEIRKKYQITTEFYSDQLPRSLDEDIEVLLFRNIRELLFNVVKHANAKKIKISIETIENNIRIIVEDDGIGFNLDKIDDTSHSNSKFGLFSIQERLNNFGGHMNIDTKPGKGCKVTLNAPLKKE